MSREDDVCLEGVPGNLSLRVLAFCLCFVGSLVFCLCFGMMCVLPLCLYVSVVVYILVLSGVHFDGAYALGISSGPLPASVWACLPSVVFSCVRVCVRTC